MSESAISDTRPPLLAEVLLPLALAKPYTYQIPAGLNLVVGDYVKVPLGARQLTGLVWALKPAEASPHKLRDIIARYDLPPMPPLLRQLMGWLADYYIEPLGNVLRLSIGTARVFGTKKTETLYTYTGKTPAKLTLKRQHVLSLVQDGAFLNQSFKPTALAALAGVSPALITGLIKEGIFAPVQGPRYKNFTAPNLNLAGKNLSPQQQEAVQALEILAHAASPQPILLHGVTGSGKTEVYFAAMNDALAKGQQVLLLLPEIALTTSFISRVEERFCCEAARWHSGLKPNARERVWDKVAKGQARIIVGARSSLFLPYANLGLIVVDEEHEQAYKQEEGVPYHARDMAVVYGALGKFPVILSSATPSLETLVNVDRGRYACIRLEKRHGSSVMPTINLIDMRQEQLASGRWISQKLTEAVTACLKSGQQALLFLNRRGYAPVTICRGCGHHVNCPHCDTSLVEHRYRQQLMCHHCGYQTPTPPHCPHCQGANKLVPCGPGIERLEEEATKLFPDARKVILSSDLAKGAELQEKLEAIAQGTYNLILGTQLVAKGHHFPGLTLVGVIDADMALETSDPRGSERTWALMAQVAGRAGRADLPGQALIQTHLPEHSLMQALKAGNEAQYLAQEKRTRAEGELPPYGRLVALIMSAPSALEAEKLAKTLAQKIPHSPKITVLGPAIAPLSVIRGRHRWRFLVRSPRDVHIQAFIQHWLKDIKLASNHTIDVDVDPYNFL